MTILQSLDRYYDRMAARNEAERPGFSREKIGFAIILSPEGEPVDALPCGSRSISSTRLPVAASAVARLIALVVLPTPPF